LRKILGALPSSERARRVREAAYYRCILGLTNRYQTQGNRGRMATHDIRVGRGPSGDQNDSIHDRGQDLDPSIRHGDSKRTTSRVPGIAQQPRVVVRHDEGDDKDPEDVKGDDPEKDSTDRSRDGSTRVSSFSDGDGDDLGTDKGKGRGDEGGEEGKEAMTIEGESVSLFGRAKEDEQ
jgi:hypothetical protein